MKNARVIGQFDMNFLQPSGVGRYVAGLSLGHKKAKDARGALKTLIKTEANSPVAHAASFALELID